MDAKENIHFLDRVADAMRKAATELEEFQVKAALGKAEAKEKYEEMKSKLKTFLHENEDNIDAGAEKLAEINMLFEHLRVQLELGKAETIDVFKEQKKKIEAAIQDIETKIKSNEKYKKAYAYVLIELEKFKVQLEFLQKKFEEGKEAAKETFEKGKVVFNDFVSNMKEKLDQAKEEGRFEHFQDEISEAFGHLKKAFAKPS
jgi:hypothetical protein